MLFMVIERFKTRDARAVYRRFQEKGRMAPPVAIRGELDRGELRPLLSAHGMRRPTVAPAVDHPMANLIGLKFPRRPLAGDGRDRHSAAVIQRASCTRGTPQALKEGA